MSSICKSYFLIVGRITVVLLLAAAILLITERLVGLSTSASEVLSSIANVALVKPLGPMPPSDAELARMRRLADRIDVIAENLANSETPAFKRRRADVAQGPDAKTSELTLDMSQGSLHASNGSLDVAINGDGFLHIKTDPRSGDGTAYTRVGAMTRDAAGNLVVDLDAGYQLIPAVNIPASATDISISTTGLVQFTCPGSGNKQVTAGQIQLVQFVNPSQLKVEGGGMYTETAESGCPIVNEPGANGAGTLQQGFIETSNVDPIREWAALLKAKRSLDLISQSMQIAVQARQSTETLANLKKS